MADASGFRNQVDDSLYIYICALYCLIIKRIIMGKLFIIVVYVSLILNSFGQG